ncbi:MAG: hypothetical protein VXZ35_09865, partial [Pseudomonadota bacterium]|nr:hypothetical protein [Pseudomonadota bacterium]
MDFDFNLNTIFEHQLQLAFSVEDLGLDQWDILSGLNLDELLAIEADSEINLLAEANFGLGFGWDLSDITQPSVYVDDTTGFDVQLRAAAEDIDFTMGIDLGKTAGSLGLDILDDDLDLVLGLIAQDGIAAIDLAFNANFGGTGTEITDLSTLGSAFQASAEGG